VSAADADAQAKCDDLCAAAEALHPGGFSSCRIELDYESTLESCSDWVFPIIPGIWHSATLAKLRKRRWCVVIGQKLVYHVDPKASESSALNVDAQLQHDGYELIDIVDLPDCHNGNHGGQCGDKGMKLYARHIRGWCPDCDKYYNAACNCTCDASGSVYSAQVINFSKTHVCNDDTLIQQDAFKYAVCDSNAYTCRDWAPRKTPPGGGTTIDSN
jgi:hypothetical protein